MAHCSPNHLTLLSQKNECKLSSRGSHCDELKAQELLGFFQGDFFFEEEKMNQRDEVKEEKVRA